MNMKCKLLAAAAAGALVVGSASFADVMDDVHPYVGAELSYNMVKHVKNKPGLGVDAGVRICDYFGLEAGYNHVLKAKLKDNKAVSFKFNNIYLDAMGYFAASPDVDLIGAVGVGRLQAKVKDSNANESDKFHKTGLRLGLGAQYKFDENIAARAMVRYQKIGGKDMDDVKRLTSVALGVAYTF